MLGLDHLVTSIHILGGAYRSISVCECVSMHICIYSGGHIDLYLCVSMHIYIHIHILGGAYRSIAAI